MHIGLNIGYNAVKAVTDARRVTFLSVVGTPDRARFSLNGHDEFLLTVNGQTWQIGQAAVRQSRFLKRREDRGWITSDEYYNLFLATLTELTTANWAEMTIITGLPVKFFRQDKDQLRARLLGEHHAQREGRNAQTFRVTTVVVIPEPFGTVSSEVLNSRGEIIDQQLANGEVGIIDVGGKTTNLLCVERLAEISHETKSVDLGGWDVVRQIDDYLSDNYPDLELRDHQIAETLKTRTTKYYGQPVDLGPTIDAIVTPMADQILGKAEEIWNVANLDAILITGGGALLLGPYLQRHFRHARIVDNPVYANAIGYWKLSQRIK